MPASLSLALPQASDTAMLTVVTSLNDKFDSTDKTFSEHITGLNEAADAMYSNATQSLQVGEGGDKVGVTAVFIAQWPAMVMPHCPSYFCHIHCSSYFCH